MRWHAPLVAIAAPGGPIGAALQTDFDRALERSRPFEDSPRLAIAVSGGADSRALALFAADWAARRGGAVIAVLIDHCLRAGSSEEIEKTLHWLALKGIEAHRLDVTVSVSGNRQAAARDARYRALLDFCLERRILHLLLGHHAGDKRETMLMRLIRGSGPEGLGGLREVEYRREARLLRPLLGSEPQALRRFLMDQGDGWIDDPSNIRSEFLRVRLRPIADLLRAEGWDAGRLAHQQSWLDQTAVLQQREDAKFLVRHATLHPAGFVRLSFPALRTVPLYQAARLLRSLLAWVRGQGEVRWQEAERLAESLTQPAFRGATLHGCRLIARRNELYICLEHPNAAKLERFSASYSQGSAGTFAYLAEDWREIRALPHPASSWPEPVLRALPVLCALDGKQEIPHITHAIPSPRRFTFSPRESAC